VECAKFGIIHFVDEDKERKQIKRMKQTDLEAALGFELKIIRKIYIKPEGHQLEE